MNVRRFFFVIGLALWLTLRALAEEITIPWYQGNDRTPFSTNLNFYVEHVGDEKTLKVKANPSNPKCWFKADVSCTSPDNDIHIIDQSGGKAHDTEASYTFRIMNEKKQGTLEVTGFIEPCEGGGGGGPPPNRQFDVTVLQQWVQALLTTNATSDVGITNLVVGAGTTNDITTAVILGDATVPASGQVAWNLTPPSLGSFTANNVALAGGKASTKFIASTEGGSGTMKTTATQLKGANNIDVPNATTNMTVNLPKVELKQMWEKDNKCNDIATQNTKGAAYTGLNRLFVSVEANNKAELHIKSTITPATTGIGSHFVWGVLDGANLLPESGTLQDDGEADLIFTTTGDHKVYTVRVGFDKNGDGKLQKEEIVETPKPPANPYTALVVTLVDYNANVQTLDNNRTHASLAEPFASTLLNLFLNQAADPIPPDSIQNSTVASTDPSLTHVAGASFNFTTCIAPVLKYIWADGSKPSDKIEDSDELKADLDAQLAALRPQVQAYFNAHPNDSHHDFSFTVVPHVIDFVANVLGHGDLHDALGVATISGTGTVTVVRHGKKLDADSLTFAGKVEDLYDFDYQRGGGNTQGATVQIGWQLPSRRSGRIFRDEVDLNRLFKNFKYQF